MAESFDPDAIWKPFGAFSQVVTGGSGKVIYLKGQVSLDPDGEIVGIDDMNAQVDQVLANINILLASMSGRMSDIVSLTQFTTDIQSFMKAGHVRQRYFTAPYPVTTTVEITSLYDPWLLIEISAIAEIPLERFTKPAMTSSMHR